MTVVDSHCHASPTWFEPVESLLHQMDRYEVEQAVLVQMMGQFNNDYLFDCVRRHPGRFAPVVLVDPAAPTWRETLERLAKRGAAGVRLPAAARSPGDDPLAIWRTAEALGLPVSCPGFYRDFCAQDFARLVEAMPRLTIVVEHLGSGMDHAPAPPDAYDTILALARFPNVCMKIHGLGEFAKRALPVTEPFPFEHPVPPMIAMARRAFGDRRLMWGSDYPPVSRREGYGNALRFPLEQFEGDEAGRALVFGDVARRVFPVRA